MPTALPTIANLLVIIGLLVLTGTLFRMRTLIDLLPAGPVRQKWIQQSGLILIFILGYLGYFLAFWDHAAQPSDLIVPGVFILGAGFVWRTITLTLQTTLDVRRVTLLEQENISDPLIEMYNRRYLDRRLAEEFARARRYQMPLALLLVDIDHFKHINDSYGHPAGDQVLRCCGALIMSAVRSTDIVARYGGDEVLIIAPITSTGEACALAERIRACIETQKQNQPRAVPFTVSIGVSGLQPGIEKVEQLLHAADSALYEAKNAGRNLVKSAYSPPGERSMLPGLPD